MEMDSGVLRITKKTLTFPDIGSGSDMSTKRDFSDFPCEAEDLSMSSRKKMKKATQRKFKAHKPIEFAEDPRVFRVQQETPVRTLPLTEVLNIQDPMSKLRSMLEIRLGVELSSFTITLQDKVALELEDSLGEQCIQTDGLAEIKVELKQLNGINRINIIDVLKYPQGQGNVNVCVVQADEEPDDVEEDSSVEDLTIKTNQGQVDDRSDASSSTSTSDSRGSPAPYSWTILHDVSSLFPVPLPSDTQNWTDLHVRHWLRWAMEEFKVKFVDDSMWTLTGKQLSQITAEEFQKKVPLDPQNMFWTHIELLRKCHIFAVVDKLGQRSATSLTKVKSFPTSSRKPRTPSASSSNGISGSGRRMSLTGNNGQIQLWQFLLELLGDKKSKSVIQWVGRDGEFKLNDPELVAQLWGQRKNKPKMNYEKLSRALRYYYSEAMIAKVHGRRFVYKFVCNLKELVGYTTQELISLVEDEPVSFEPLG